VREHVAAEDMIRVEDIAEAVRFVLKTSPNRFVPEIVSQRPGEALRASPRISARTRARRRFTAQYACTSLDGHRTVGPITGEDTVATLRARLEETERQTAARQRQLERYAADLREVFKQERARSQELRRSYMATVRALSNAVEARDAYTGKHAERVAAYGIELAAASGLEIADSPQIEFGFLLHDIGKVGVPDAILFKTSSLTEEEYALVRRHPIIGSEILRDVDFLGEGKLVVRHHHERWDGTGYPDGLRGDTIPLAARVFAVADALDALTTDRPYRPASTFDHARAVVRDAAGTQFDPAVVDAYEQIPDDTFDRLRRSL
jgi:ribonuclease P protein subunit RPR2